MKKHLVETISSDAAYKADSFVAEKEAEGWELITPIQIIQPIKRGTYSVDCGWIILTFEREV